MKTSFAAQVLNIVRSNKPKKFGEKAYIYSVWQVGFTKDLSLAEFKKRLIVEHQAGRLELSRADLIAAMDPIQIEYSETRHLNASFHFIRSEAPSVQRKPKMTPTDIFRSAVDAVTTENNPGALLSVREVRARAGLPKDEFDTIALGLQRTRELVLHHHDFPQSLTVREREQFIRAPNGVYYVGLALPTARKD